MSRRFKFVPNSTTNPDPLKLADILNRDDDVYGSGSDSPAVWVFKGRAFNLSVDGQDGTASVGVVGDELAADDPRGFRNLDGEVTEGV